MVSRGIFLNNSLCKLSFRNCEVNDPLCPSYNPKKWMLLVVIESDKEDEDFSEENMNKLKLISAI